MRDDFNGENSQNEMQVWTLESCWGESPEPKVKVMISMYMPLEITKCSKCGKVIAEPKELIRITKDHTP